MDSALACANISANIILLPLWLALGVANTVIAYQTINAQNQHDSYVWACILAIGLLQLISFIRIGFRTCYVKNYALADRILIIVLMSCHITASIILLSASNECYSFYKNNYPSLWNMLIANTVSMPVMLGVLAGRIVSIRFIKKRHEEYINLV